MLELLAIAITEKKGIKGIKIESKYVKLLTFRWHNFVLKNIFLNIRKFLDLINTIRLQDTNAIYKKVALIYTNKERLSHSKELLKIKYIPKKRKSFTIKISNYLEKKIQGDTRRREDCTCSWNGSINVAKIAIISKLITRCNAILIKILMSYFTILEKII